MKALAAIRRWLDRRRGVYRTKSGRVLRDSDFEALADEAERGYDITELNPVTPERRAALRGKVR